MSNRNGSEIYKEMAFLQFVDIEIKRCFYSRSIRFKRSTCIAPNRSMISVVFNLLITFSHDPSGSDIGSMTFYVLRCES